MVGVMSDVAIRSRASSDSGQIIRRALVTGGSRGIGASIVRRLCRDGFDVYFNYLSDHEAADALVDELSEDGLVAIAFQKDLRSNEEIEELFSEVTQSSGGLDVLICNAASGVYRSIEEIRDRHWRWVFDTNAQSLVRLVQHALPLLEKSPVPRVVALTSRGARSAIRGYTLVGATKAAVEALVRHLALELGPRGIPVNAVCPGLVRTDAIRAFCDEANIAETERRTPAGRLVTGDDVAGLVSFLCGDDADMIRGQVLVVDGGYEIVA